VVVPVAAMGSAPVRVVHIVVDTTAGLAMAVRMVCALYMGHGDRCSSWECRMVSLTMWPT
jgi:hypothetical protein